MRYADEQIVRPQHENGCDYGCGRRSVLVQNTITHPKKGRIKVQLIHVGGSKHWGGIGAGRYYGATEIAIYPTDDGSGCRQKALAEGRMTRAKWEEIALEIYSHLQTEFPLELVSLKHTLLLDEPGEVDGPPPRDPAKKVMHPRIESDCVYRVFRDEDGKYKFAEGKIVKQGGGKITYKLGSGREIEKRTRTFIEEGGAGSREEAAAAYLREFEERRNSATERLQRAAQSFAYADDQFTEAKNHIEEMLSEELS
jgi:hypothetical protein